MADYSERSLDLLAEVDALEHELQKTYVEQAQGRAGNHAQRIGKMHHRQNLALKQAEVYATHALRQAVEQIGLSS